MSHAEHGGGGAGLPLWDELKEAARPAAETLGDLLTFGWFVAAVLNITQTSHGGHH